MGDGGERDPADDMLSANDNLHDGVVIEGLRPPLTRSQRLRRVAIASVAVACVLAVWLWPAISSLSDLVPLSQPMAQATATPGFSWHSIGGVSVIAGGTVEVGVTSGIPICPVTRQIPSSLGLPEMHADTSGNGDVWALLLSGSQILSGRDVKIAWRATGSGSFHVVALESEGAPVLPISGPDPHPNGSNWQRAGDEWGTVFNFPNGGCWQLQADRGTTLSASIWLAVSPRVGASGSRPPHSVSIAPSSSSR
jgi:hypothetical protein